MVAIGKRNKLEVVKLVDFGVYLDGDQYDDILLPKRYVPKDTELGDVLDVFIYLDSEDKLIATTLTPKVMLNELARLKVVSVTSAGAFLDWGLPKDLFVPFSEQQQTMEEGRSYMVYVFMDEETERLAGSSKLNRYIGKGAHSLQRGDKVELVVTQRTDLGYVVAIDKDNGLMLQSMIISQSGKPLERFQYVDISFSPQLDSIQISEQWHASQATEACRVPSQLADDSLSKWQPTWLPSGFVLSSYKANRSTGKETWVYTDGLATFSIFIDSSEVSKNFPPVQATLGTTVAVLNKVNLNNTQYAITVVGEIPTLTAQQIVADISPRIRALPDSQ